MFLTTFSWYLSGGLNLLVALRTRQCLEIVFYPLLCVGLLDVIIPLFPYLPSRKDVFSCQWLTFPN